MRGGGHVTESRLSNFVLAAAVALVLFLLTATPAQADTTINVDATCSLAQAIKSANGLTGQSNIGGCEDGTEPSSGEDGRDTIDIGRQTIRLTANLPFITSKVKINGNGNHVTGEDKYEIFTITNGADVEINNLKIEFGRSATNGGGISVTGSSVSLFNVRMQGNRAARGGAIYANSASVTINRGVFLDNVAQNGGAIYADMSGSASIRTSLTNTMVYHNTASGAGGGIYITGSNANAQTDLRYVTMTRNTATGGNGGGIYNSGRSLNVRRSIIYGNTGSDCKLANSPTIAFTQNIIDPDSDAACKTSQDTRDPLLAPPDYSGAQIRIHYQLYVGSPALNAADPSESGRTNCWSNTVDVFGTTRPVGTGCEYGAWEGVGVALPPPPTDEPTAEPTAEDPPPDNNNPPPENNNPPPDNNNPPPDNNNPPPDNNNPPPDNNNPPPENGNPPGANSNQGQLGAARAATPTPTPVISTCQTLPENIEVKPMIEQTQCQRVSGAAISDPALMPMATDAVDVWSWVQPGTKVCFKGDSGSIRFIDTNSMPRRTMDKPTFSDGGMICAMIDGPGIAVLVEGPPGAPLPPSATPLPVAPATPAPPRTLSNCTVTTTEILYFRESPGGGLVIREWIPNSWLPKGASLTAVEWRGGWYKVDYYGVKGWISADYVERQGDCG